MGKIIFSDKQFLIVERKNFRYLYLFGFFSKPAFHGLMEINCPNKIFGYEFHMGEAIKKIKPKNAIVIGVGAGSIIRFLRNYHVNCKILAIDILPELPNLIRNHFNSFPVDDFIATSIIDCSANLNGKKFDLAVIDVYGSDGVVGYSQSEQIVIDSYSWLNPGGLLVQHFYVKPYEPGAIERLENYCLLLRKYFHSVNISGKLHGNEEAFVLSATKGNV